MGAITFSLDENLAAFLAGELPLGLFIETGAFHGDSLEAARRHFPECRSCEVSPELHERVRTRFAGQSNIKVQLSDSPAFLAGQRTEFAARPSLFWLDAHWCQAEKTAGRSSQSPLLSELAAIRPLHPDSVILIDDARLYLCAPPHPQDCAGWPDFHAVLTLLLSLSSQHRVMVLNDVIIFFPARISAAMNDFAHRHGADWLVINHLLQACHARERERQARRFPSVNYFRHLIRPRAENRFDHASH
jgi:hypothetical protein